MQSISDFLSSLLGQAGDQQSFVQMLMAVGIAYFGGILSSLTPCVYPMIPITVSVVGGMPLTRHPGHTHPAHSHKKPWSEILLRGLSYIFGMTVIYSFLGVAAGLSGKVFGTFTNTSGWYLTLGLIMSIAALMMLDVIPFDPAVWWDQFKRKVLKQKSPGGTSFSHDHGKEMTLIGAFSLGASSGFIAAPCTTPVLTAILAYIAKTQSIGFGLALMIAFSLGLGTLLLLVATFAGALQVLPKSGKWLKAVKILSGLILLAFADYLLYRAGSLGGS